MTDETVTVHDLNTRGLKKSVMGIACFFALVGVGEVLQGEDQGKIAKTHKIIDDPALVRKFAASACWSSWDAGKLKRVSHLSGQPKTAIRCPEELPERLAAGPSGH